MAAWLHLEEDSTAYFEINGFPTIEATVVKEARPLGRWVIFKCGGYPTKLEAEMAGSKFQNILSLNGALGKLGIDIGHSKTTLQFSQAVHQAIRNQSGRELKAEIHGLSVYEEDATVIMLFEGHAIVQTPVDKFSKQLSQLTRKDLELSNRQKACAALLNDSFFVTSSEAQFILRICAVETLCDQHDVDAEYKLAIEGLIQQADKLKIAKSTKLSIKNRLENLKRIGVLRSIELKFLDKLEPGHWQVFKQLYSKRSEFLHDGKWRGQLGEAADQSLEMGTALLAADIAIS